MKLFDLHCDSPLRLYRRGASLYENDLHVSLKKASVFERYLQCAAVWSDERLSDSDCLALFINACRYFRSEAEGLMIGSREDLEKATDTGFILTVEDARLLCKDLENLSLLFKCGVRVLTLLWSGESSVGCAWDTEGSLSRFGKEVLEGCFDIGIIPDLSHANDTVTSYAIERSIKRGKPVIATHSNSRAVCPHMRNMTDENAQKIAENGGIIGVSLFPPHLKGETAGISDVLCHIGHYINVCGSESICLGCDLDGIDTTPEEISHVGDLERLYDPIEKAFGSKTADGITFNNAYKFFLNNLPQG